MYYVKNVEIKGFWGTSKIITPFFDDVNVFIGRNGSGKTTFINILRAALTVDLEMLAALKFDEAKVLLASGDYRKTIKVVRLRDEVPFDVVEYSIGLKKYRVSLVPSEDEFGRSRFISQYEERIEELRAAMSSIVNISWLSVHREHTDFEDKAPRRKITRGKNPVDRKLAELMVRFTRYQLQLANEASALSMDFQKKVLELMLYDQRFDKWRNRDFTSTNFGALEKDLRHAYEDLGLSGPAITKKIEEHILKISEATQTINKAKAEQTGLTVDNVLPIALYLRSEEIRNISTELEKQKKDLMAPVTKYMTLLKSFITNMDFLHSPEEEGGLLIRQGTTKLEIGHLSSGEKQLLILLTEALLQKSQKCVFIADEPELSLHIEWQKMLLTSVKELNPQAQIIVATHSPEIAADWRKNILSMESILHA